MSERVIVGETSLSPIEAKHDVIAGTGTGRYILAATMFAIAFLALGLSR